MARLYCKDTEPLDVAPYTTFVERRGLTQDASRLTLAGKQEIMAEPGIRSSRVAAHAFTRSKEIHERLQPQGGRSIRAFQQIGSRGRNNNGERSGGVDQLSQRRSGAGGAPAFHQSFADRFGKADSSRGLHGKASASSQVTAGSFSQRAGITVATALLFSLFLLTGCGGHKQARVDVPPPPPISASETSTGSAGLPSTKTVPAPTDHNALEIPAGAKPLLVETGLASWYGAPYHNRRGSNGEIYDMHALTAAHRTLPLGSIVRVTNVKTGRSVLVRITDRGPFIEGRILDLSQAAAEKVDLRQAGVGMVRMEVLRSPVPLNAGGRWAVQIGAFEQEHAADKLADHLSQRYHTAKVQCFSSPIGDWWVRVRVHDDDRKLAEEVAHNTQTPQGAIFLVRLD